MFNTYELDNVLKEIKYKDWDIEVTIQVNYNLSLVRWSFKDNGKIQKGRWWVIDHNQPISDVPRTMLLAAIVAEEHETREQFKYKGKRIFGPHFDVNKLTEIAGKLENLEIPS